MSDSEYEEEEILVYADFKNQLLPHEVNDPKAAIKIIGIENKTPIAEINGNVFKGTYDFSMGTNVFFVKDSNAVTTDPLYEASCKQQFKYICKTNKVINFQRIYVESTAKEAESGETSGGEPLANTEKGESLKLNITYEEAVKQFPIHHDNKLQEGGSS